MTTGRINQVATIETAPWRKVRSARSTRATQGYARLCAYATLIAFRAATVHAIRYESYPMDPMLFVTDPPNQPLTNIERCQTSHVFRPAWSALELPICEWNTSHPCSTISLASGVLRRYRKQKAGVSSNRTCFPSEEQASVQPPRSGPKYHNLQAC